MAAPHTVSDWQEAERRTLDDVDTFADDLAGACSAAKRAEPLPARLTAEAAMRASDPQILRTGLQASLDGRHELASLCMRVLAERYLRRHVDYTARIADEERAAA